MTSLVRRAVAPIVLLREGESTTAILLFAYSFLAMTAYNIVKPITRSKFISDLGADNLPWVQLAAGILIGVIMQVYSRMIAAVPRQWAIPVTQAGCIALLLAFWVLFSSGSQWASVGFYVLGLILGILLVSQFWTLANDIYDARQAKRLFGFIGAGSSVGGATGAAITALVVTRVGTVNLLLVSAAVLAICMVLVIVIVRRERPTTDAAAGMAEEGVGGGEAITLLRQSRHLQIIAIVIGCAAMGGAIIEQQLNMAAQARIGQEATDGITQFLAQVTVYLSLIGFVIQIGLTSRIHRLLGLGFALMILPVSLGTTAGIMLVNAGLWAPALARVLDTSLRYTVDKTTREILFLPLPTAIKYRAKPFVDVTMDRFAKALGALTILVLIKPWGLSLTWQQLSYASLTLTAVWVVMAIRAKREYLAVFRRSIERHEVEPADLRAPQADLQSIETLVEELAHPDDERVLYAIELLESLDKRNLVTPLLLHHPSPRVRARTLQTLEAMPAERTSRWQAAVEPLLADGDANVRAAAIRAVAAMEGQKAADLMRRYLSDPDPRLVVSAASALAASTNPADVDAAEEALQRLLLNSSHDAVQARCEVARALGHMPGTRFRHLLASLLLDADIDVARAAVASAGEIAARTDEHGGSRSASDALLFVPPLVSLLRNRLLKEDVRKVLTAYGEGAIEPLAYFLHDQDEQIWVRRNVPAVLAHLPAQRTVDVLVETLVDQDGFLRYKAVTALSALRRSHPHLTFRREPIEKLALDEVRRYCNALTLHANLTAGGGAAGDSMLARALDEKQRRGRDRIFRLLGLMYPQKDIRAARLALEQGDARARASASEYLDNLLGGPLGKRVMLIVDEMPHDERVRKANVLYRTRPRDVDDTLAQLIHDDDAVLASAAIHLVAERGVGSLTDDLYYVLAHRDARDWYVFEAASWALAATRMAVDERRARWLEPLPAVEVANRLRRISLFDRVSIDELFRIASTGRQVRHERGRVVCASGQTPDSLQLLVDGEVVLGRAERITAPAALVFDETLGAVPLAEQAVATDMAITLALTQDEFRTLLSDNIEIAQGLFAMRIDLTAMADDRSILRGRVPVSIAGAGRLTPIERALALRSSALLERATSDQLLALSAIAREEALAKGEVAIDADDPSLYVLLSAAVMLERPGAAAAASTPMTAHPGDTIGVYETLTGARTGTRLTVIQPGQALRIDRSALFELLADHVDLVNVIFSAVTRRTSPAPLAASHAAAVHQTT